MLTFQNISGRYVPALNRWRLRPARMVAPDISFQRNLLVGSNIVIIGSPASGKSTLAESLGHFGAQTRSVAEICKQFIRGERNLAGSDFWPQLRKIDTDLPEDEPELRTFLESLRKQGHLMPVPVVAALVFDELKKTGPGWVLESVRTEDFADLLLQNFRVDKAIFLEISPEMARARSLARGRDTDNPQAFENKLKAFQEHLPKVLETFSTRGLLATIDASVNPREMTQKALDILNKDLQAVVLKRASRLDFTKPRTRFMATVNTSGIPEDLVRRLILAGTNIFRFTFNFIKTDEDRAQAGRLFGLIRKVAAENNQVVGCAADLPGPGQRIGGLNQPFELQNGQEIFLTQSEASASEQIIPVCFSDPQVNFIEAVNSSLRQNTGQKPLRVLIDHAQIVLEILKIERKRILSRVVKGGLVHSGKSVSFPGVIFKTSPITPFDEAGLQFAQRLGYDYVVQSFVTRRKDIGQMKALMQTNGTILPIIAKIEAEEALRDENLNGIAQAADALMIARGHLADETGSRSLVPIAQDKIEYYARKWGKPVILATEVYSSMMREIVPNRADADNVYRAIKDGIDMIMLSGAETVLSPHPVLVVETIVDQAGLSENSLETNELFRLMRKQRRLWFSEHFEREVLPGILNPTQRHKEQTIFAFSRAALNFFEKKNIKAAVMTTSEGRLARYFSRWLPHLKIIAITSCEKTAKELLLYRGVYPVLVEDWERQPAGIFLETILENYSLLKSGEKGIFIVGDENTISQGSAKLLAFQKN